MYTLTHGGGYESNSKRLRFYSKDLLDTVSRGGEVIITYRGEPCAKLVHLSNNTGKQKNELFGIWKDYDEVK
jgi:prevent-host-death family protein